MRNLILGIMTGIAGTYLFYLDKSLAWYVWVLFGLGCAALIFGFDVLFGSFKEHEPRAAWMGFGLFGGAGIIMLLATILLSFENLLI